jgi:hypothetical protein
VQIRPFSDAPFAKTGNQRFPKVAQGHFFSLKKLLHREKGDAFNRLILIAYIL